jgi:hypothetical protein
MGIGRHGNGASVMVIPRHQYSLPYKKEIA